MIRRPPRSPLFPSPPLFRPPCAPSTGHGAPAPAPPSHNRGTPGAATPPATPAPRPDARHSRRSEEHTSELQSRQYLVCRLLLEKKKKTNDQTQTAVRVQ